EAEQSPNGHRRLVLQRKRRAGVGNVAAIEVIVARYEIAIALQTEQRARKNEELTTRTVLESALGSLVEIQISCLPGFKFAGHRRQSALLFEQTPLVNLFSQA